MFILIYWGPDLFPLGPFHKVHAHVMAVEFDGQWAGAVLEGNEIVPELVQMRVGPQTGSGSVGLYLPRLDTLAFEDLGEQLTGSERWQCWQTWETEFATKGWRQRLSPRQAREFEIIYCAAVVGTAHNRDLVDCAFMRDGELDCSIP